MKLAIRSIPTVFLVLLLTIAGCDGSGSSGNEPPVIEEVLVDPSTPTPGRIVSLTAVATDSEDDDLSYAWDAEAGHFEGGTTENPGRWRAPTEPGDYEIKCTVNDGQSAVSETMTVQVREDSQ